MTGPNKGVTQRLKETFSYLVGAKDISHGLDNVFKKALPTFSNSAQDVIKGISSHFHYSTKNSSLLRETLLEMGLKPLEILHLSPTRWLSMRDCIHRILELWVGLESYFGKFHNKFCKTYFSAENELSIRVLALLINNITDLNEYFQKDNLLYNEVLEKMKHSYVTIANTIITKAERSMDFEQIFSIPFEKTSNKDFFAGIFNEDAKKFLTTVEEFESQFLIKYDSIKELLTKVEAEKKKEILLSCLKFLYDSKAVKGEVTIFK